LERIRGLGWLNVVKKKLSIGGVDIEKHSIFTTVRYTSLLIFSGVCSSLTVLLQSLALFSGLDETLKDTETEAKKYVTLFWVFILQWTIPCLMEYCNRSLYRSKRALCEVEYSIYLSIIGAEKHALLNRNVLEKRNTLHSQLEHSR
jgi:hypothetical protein